MNVDTKANITRGFRKIKRYHAIHMNSHDRNMFTREINNKHLEYNSVGELSREKYFFKYLGLEKAKNCIQNEELLFVEPSCWKDKYEKRFYDAIYDSQKALQEIDCPLLFATCMTTIRSNEAAWSLYTDEKYCVEFKLNKHKFRRELVKAAKKDDCIYEGIVKYLGASYIDHMHQKKIDKKGKSVDNELYRRYVLRRSGVPYLNNYLNLLLIKRFAFKHEMETRFFIVRKEDAGKQKAQRNGKYNGQSIKLNIDWIDIIERVYINAEEDSDAYSELSAVLKQKLEEKFDGITNPIRLKEKEEIWDKKLKPKSFFIYGRSLNKRLTIE